MTRSHVMILAVGHREKLQAGGHGGFSLIPTGFVSWCGLGAALVGTLQVFSLPMDLAYAILESSLYYILE